MTMPATWAIEIDDELYRLWEVAGVPQFAAIRIPAPPPDAGAVRRKVVIPFGNNGIGAHYDVPEANNQHSWSANARTWVRGELGPGHMRTAMGYVGGRVIKLVSARDANGRRLVYAAGAGGAGIMKKIDMDQATPTNIAGGSVTFSGAPTITDVLVLRDGAATGISPRTIAAYGTTQLVVAFGETRIMNRCSTIDTGSAADTYVDMPAGTYGGLLAVTSTTSSDPVLWKTTAENGTTTGAFSRIQSTTVPEPFSAAFGPTPGVRVGSKPGSSITALFNHSRGLGVATPEGIWLFDQNANSYLRYGMESYRSDENGKNTRVVGSTVIVPTINDLEAFDGPGNDGAIGLTRLPSLSPNAYGYPTAVTADGDDMYVAFWNGVSSTIYRMKSRSSTENVNHAYLMWPFATVFAECRALLCTVNTAGKKYLLAGAGGDVYWWHLGTFGSIASVHWSTGAQWFSPIRVALGDSEVIENLIVDVVDADASNYIVPFVAPNAEGLFTNLPAITSEGRKTIVPSVTLASGLFQFGFTWVLGDTTVYPKLVGGGIVATVVRLENTAAGYEVKILCGTGNSRTEEEVGWKVYSDLAALGALTSVDVRCETIFGDSDIHNCVIREVRMNTNERHPNWPGRLPETVVTFQMIVRQ